MTPIPCPAMLIVFWLAGMWIGHSGAKYARGKKQTRFYGVIALLIGIGMLVYNEMILRQ